MTRPSEHSRRRGRAVQGVSASLLLAVAGCGWSLDARCGVPPQAAADAGLSPIARALHFLRQSQLAEDQPPLFGQDFAGAWPQCFAFSGRAPFLRDVSPFMASFIHHALTLITPANRDALGLTDADIDAARRLRKAAVDFILRFRSPPGEPDAGTIGFWPKRREFLPPGDALLAAYLDQVMPGPYFNGYLAPLNLPWFVPHLMIQPDADCTATGYAVLLDDAAVDGGPPVDPAFARFFSDWRDLGQVDRRADPIWLPPRSGAYLTWLAYRDDPADPAPNDVDPVVNANVLYALGRAGRLGTPGVDHSVAAVDAAVDAYLAGRPFTEISLYYPDNGMLQYAVTRAAAGGVAGLAPAAASLADNLLATVQSDADGRAVWDRGAPSLYTSTAIVALLNAGRSGEIVNRAVDSLEATQSPDGSWPPELFFLGRLDDGTEIHWVSTSLTTGIALEALCRHRLGE